MLTPSSKSPRPPTDTVACQKCPFAAQAGQTGQSLRKRIIGHKSVIKYDNTQPSLAEHFNLPGSLHS